jgi:hypothetical protein
MLPDPNGKTGQKECGIKVKHDSLDSAFQHASEMKDLPNRTKETACIYRCRYCGKWHVGHVGARMSKTRDFFMYENLKTKRVTSPGG